MTITAQNLLKTIADRVAEEAATGQLNTTRRVPTPSIPKPDKTIESLYKSVQALKTSAETREGVSGSVMDKFVTLRDLLDSGIVGISVNGRQFLGTRSSVFTPGTVLVPAPAPSSPGGFVDPRPVLSTPPTITNLQAMGAFRNVILTWDMQEYQNHSHTEIWRHTTNNLAVATQVGQSTANVFADATGVVGTTYFYWVRAVGVHPTTGAPITGAFNAGVSGGTSAGLLRIGNTDLSDAIIDAVKLADGAVTAVKFATGVHPVNIGSALPALPNAAYPDGAIFVNTTDHKVYRSTGTTWTAQVDGADVAAGTIAASRLIAGTITAGSGVIANAAIENGMIANAAIDSAKIANAAIVTAKIADAQITTAKVADATITNAKIVDLDGGKITANSVTADKIDSRNLTVKDGAGNIIFGASQNLDISRLNTAIEFAPYLVWDFQSSTNGWTGEFISLATGSEAVTITATGVDPTFRSPVISLNGERYNKVRARVQRTAGSAWDGTVYYTTAGHSESDSFKKTIPDKTVIGQWVVLEWDMLALTAGGTDWSTSTIQQIRIDFGASGLDVFAVDWVAIGRHGPFKFDTNNVSTFIANGVIGAAQIGSLNVGVMSTALNGGASTGARVEMTLNKIRVYDSSNVLRVAIGDLS